MTRERADMIQREPASDCTLWKIRMLCEDSGLGAVCSDFGGDR